MKIKSSNILWGLAFILVGVLLYCKAFLDIDISIWNIFFRIWPAAIIIPNLFSLFTSDRKMSNIFWLIVGIILILLTNGIISGSVVKKIVFPLLLIFIGISIMFKGIFRKGPGNIPVNGTSSDFSNSGNFKKPEYVAVFSSSSDKVAGESFYGCEVTSVFGSAVLDLREAIITEDIVIDANVIFAGADIFVPSNVNVKISSVPIFGGVSNKTLNQNVSGPTVFINAVCMFGGLDIK